MALVGSIGAVDLELLFHANLNAWSSAELTVCLPIRAPLAHVPYYLLVIGLGMIAGSLVGGWFADRFPRASILLRAPGSAARRSRLDIN
jgi:hypothetical protein